MANINDRKYNLVTLIPKDKEERKDFWNFRFDDMIEIWIWTCIFEGVFWLGVLFSLIWSQGKLELIRLFLYTGIFAMTIIIQ